MTSYNPDQWQEAIAGLASAGVTATNPSVGTDGAAIPTSSTLLGASDGTNLQPLQVDGSKNLKVNVVTGGGSNASVGTAGAAAPTSDTLMGGTDGTNLRPVTVAIFHNSDSQTLPSGSYGLLTGGIAQIVNASGTVDRQRGTGFDAVPAVGIASGAQQLAGPALTTTFNGAVTGSASAQSVVVASSASMKVGDIIVTQDAVEYVEILSIADATHCNGVFKNNHASGQTLTWYHYNQARDATVGDAVATTGMGASATYLWNSVNSTLELARSASAELDGASGKGTAVAAEYEYNGGGPGSGSYDRARNIQGKGVTTNTLNGAANAGQNQAILNTGSVPVAGQPVYLQGGTAEVAYVSSVTSQTITFTANLVNTHANATNVQWDTYASSGTGLNAFLPTGIGLSEEVLYNAVDGNYYGERSATADALAGANIPAESLVVWNGSTFDRLKGDNVGAARVSLYVKTTAAGDTVLALGSATGANSLPVVIASDQAPLGSATATRTNVTAAASDTSLLASNTSRKGALFFNDSTAILYLAYGAGAASTTSYTVQVPANSLFEMPPAPVYTGAIRGIWSAVNGSVRITELS